MYTFAPTAKVLDNLSSGVPTTILSFNRKNAFLFRILDQGRGKYQCILEAFQINGVDTDKCSSVKGEGRIFD